MAINGTVTETTLTGRVVSVNEKGLKFEGAGEWCNYSKFAVGIVAPQKDQTVTITLDKGGFIRTVVPADGSTVSLTPHAAAGATSGQHRDRTITRLAVLKAAAEFGAARPNLKSGEVLKIAASWERWINREQDNTYDLTDAF